MRNQRLLITGRRDAQAFWFDLAFMVAIGIFWIKMIPSYRDDRC